jgi:hypothetical protein
VGVVGGRYKEGAKQEGEKVDADVGAIDEDIGKNMRLPTARWR